MVEYPTGRHSYFVINIIKVSYVLRRRPCVCFERITEAIHSDLFQEFPDANKLFAVVPFNPIAKQFTTIINIHTHINISTQPYPTTFLHPELLQLKI